MALQCKRPHIRLDKGVWDDPVLVELTPEAFRVWVFGIAWSRSQEGRVPEGILTPHGLTRIGATPDILAELSSVKSKLLVQKDDGTYEIAKYAEWQVLSSEEKTARDARSAGGMIATSRRYGGDAADLPPMEEGFGWRDAFEAAFEHWPKDGYNEGKGGAISAFRMFITNQATYELFEACLVARVRSYKADKRAPSVKRPFLGAFKNFCDPDRWGDWVPKNMQAKLAQDEKVQSESQSPASPKTAPELEAPPPTSSPPAVAAEDDVM